MPRLLVHVEGQTEETFVNEVLGGHLRDRGYSIVSARLVGNPRLRKRRGGIRSWESARKDILRHLKEDAQAVATTMVDYYALPYGWPGRAEAPNQASTVLKAEYVENAHAEDIAAGLTPRFDSRRFVPYVIMHEFEGLLFSNPARFAEAVGKSELVQAFSSIRAKFQSPEDINDSDDTAPSRRILKIFPGYEKPLSGTLAVIAIGLDGIRDQCPHFNDWLNRLEALPAVPG